MTCHSDIQSFPHPERTAESIREFKLEYYTICQDCHEEQFKLTLDSVHQKALAGGNNNAAVCTDCHNPHTQQKLTNDGYGRTAGLRPPAHPGDVRPVPQRHL
ncbi:MAG: hypothetical protein MZV49_25395 [Rhodopseudomonas palustris]|nr:hypothetical protein [Rhodopseudomonas palustris]